MVWTKWHEDKMAYGQNWTKRYGQNKMVRLIKQ